MGHPQECGAVSLHLLHRLVALPHSLIVGLLLERDLTTLLEVLLTHLLLTRLELGDIGVVTLLNILVGALQDGLLLQCGHLLLLLHTTQSSLGVLLTPTEVNSSLNSSIILLSANSRQLLRIQTNKVSQSQTNTTRHQQELLHFVCSVYRLPFTNPH